MNIEIIKNYDMSNIGERLIMGYVYFKKIQGKKKNDLEMIVRRMKYLFFFLEFLV